MLETEKNNLQELSEDVTSTKSELKSEKEEITEVSETTKSSETKTEEQVVNEIDDEIAELSEKTDDDVQEVVTPKAKNYDKMDLELLVNNFESLLKNNSIQKINNEVNAIKNSFNTQFAKILAEKKAAFLADGGESIDFSYTNPNKVKFNELCNDFRNSRTKYYKDLEIQLKDNLEIRFSVIEQLKDLIENAEPSTMHNKFRDIQDRWRKIGPVSREKYNGTWRTFHHHVERFYDLLHLSNDFRELDFKHNLDEKLKLITKVEKLAESNDINQSFKQLQVIHKMWKEDIGPVDREHREDVWKKFSAATKKIHDKRHDFYRSLKGKLEDNIDRKLEVIDQINKVDTSNNVKHSDWQRSIKEIEGLREQFFKAGNVPKSESDKIWAKFKEATRNFNHNKNSFYKSIKSVQQENLDKKMKLIALAESHKESEDWEAVTDIMKKIQSDWKKIGHVPRKYSDKIWSEFKGACNHYFDRFHAHKNEGSIADQEVFNNKKAFLDNMKEEIGKGENLDIDTVKLYTKEWNALGNVPFNLRHIESKFTKTLEKVYSQLSIDPTELEMMKFENLIEGYLELKNYRKLDSEQLYLRKKIDETNREIQQLENNISFFSNADENNPLLKNVMKSIEEHKENHALLKSKLNYISQLDY